MIVNSNKSKEECFMQILAEFEKHKFITVSIAKCTRTIKQNSYIYRMYSDMSKQGDLTAVEYRRLCKYKYGCQIRAAKEPEFAEMLRPMLQAHTYEKRLKAMDYIDITSTFDVEQLSEYITAIQVDMPQFKYPSKDY